MATALREVCGLSLGSDPDPDRATVVVHVADGEPPALRGGITISSETLSRVCCDSRLQVLVESADGRLVRAAETMRTVPAFLRRYVEHRDGGCTFPSCGRIDTLLHCHHIVPWDHGGTTEQDNLTLLCHRHHTLVHEGGWQIRGSPREGLAFHRPDGASLTPPAEVTWDDARAALRAVVEQLGFT